MLYRFSGTVTTVCAMSNQVKPVGHAMKREMKIGLDEIFRQETLALEANPRACFLYGDSPHELPDFPMLELRCPTHRRNRADRIGPTKTLRALGRMGLAEAKKGIESLVHWEDSSENDHSVQTEQAFATFGDWLVPVGMTRRPGCIRLPILSLGDHMFAQEVIRNPDHAIHPYQPTIAFTQKGYGMPPDTTYRLEPHPILQAFLPRANLTARETPEQDMDTSLDLV